MISLHQPYNYAVSTAILLLCTVYSTFFLCLQVCFPFLLSESRFCRFSLNFASLVFYFFILNQRLAFNVVKQHESLFQQSVIAVFISLFKYLLPISTSVIQIQFKTLRLACVVSSFHKAFVQFLSRSIELILK